MREFARRRGSRRGGFTLVELLVVIVIITILMSLLVVGAFLAVERARRIALMTELNLLATSIKQYETRYGAYPPDKGANLEPHLKTIFPLRNAAGDAAPTGLNGAQLLVFCLRGYKPNAMQPVTGAGERSPLFDFDMGRIVHPTTRAPVDIGSISPVPLYVPKFGKELPYYYFERGDPANPYVGDSDTTYSSTPAIPRLDVAAKSRPFQVICGGPDASYAADSMMSSVDDELESK